MSEQLQVTQSRIRAGIWEGVLSGSGPQPPGLEVSLAGQAIGAPEVTALPGQPGSYALRFAIPATALSEGAQTFLILQGGSGAEPGTALAHFTILTGIDSAADLRAELDLLRAELDLLKRAFRRHCLETGATG
ncbi:hypothetical protein [Pseudogemmobacter faecipullorum]|uniref:Uncharacterized protein n=1 Tax=Pseudogemmobacter faecipullorum TaxID=2755041 RepID=A0ABS8CGP7_9RHOB|nr:hypothetical protein [Pseudogemmobacter faecipullorum]MCB5408547.1 hypothetical protein [Pseudogemmobacter faecipullorum]